MTLADLLESGRPKDFAEWYRDTIPRGYTFPRHIEFLCGVAQKLIDGEYQRVCISTPPGHAKSETITRRLAVWWGQHRRDEKIVVTGYSQRFAEKNLSAPAREMAKELGVMSPNSTALDEWHFTNGSKLLARGVGNPPTGVNPITLAVIDDPISSREDAASEIMRENIWGWWTGSIVQRFWPDTRALVIATRWHEDDLIGRLKASDTAHLWEFINLPAIAEEDDILGREVGEALWPEAKPIEFLEQLRLEMGEYEFEALYQGNPTPREGALFKVSQFGTREDRPDCSNVLEFDFGSTTQGDFTAAGQVWRDPVTGRFTVDVSQVQLEPYKRDVWIRSESDAREPMEISIPQDPGAAGKAQADSFIRLLAGHNVRITKISGDKETRAMPFASQVNAGNVDVVESPFRNAFIEQCRQFPGGKHDDMVDAVAGAFNQLAAKRKPGASLKRKGHGLV